MKSMKLGLALFVVAGTAGIAAADDFTSANSYFVQARLWNDFSATNLTINGVSYPAPGTGSIAGTGGPVVFDEQFAQGATGNYANKHVAWFSNDGGASPMTTNRGQSWSLAFTVNMAANSTTPRKEAGIEIHQPRAGGAWIDEGQVLIASDNGEVAVFGATLPFTGFGTGVYTAGTTASVLFEYFAPGVQDPSLGAYRLRFLDAVTGMHDSGIKVWSNSEFDGVIGLTNATIGLKDQNQRNPFIADGIHLVYDGVTLVPAPGAAALLGLAGLAGLRRRR